MVSGSNIKILCRLIQGALFLPLSSKNHSLGVSAANRWYFRGSRRIFSVRLWFKRQNQVWSGPGKYSKIETSFESAFATLYLPATTQVDALAPSFLRSRIHEGTFLQMGEHFFRTQNEILAFEVEDSVEQKHASVNKEVQFFNKIDRSFKLMWPFIRDHWIDAYA